MKKWSGGVLIVFLFILLVIRYSLNENSLRERFFLSPWLRNSSSFLLSGNAGLSLDLNNPENSFQVVSVDSFVLPLFNWKNISDNELLFLQTWKHLKRLIGEHKVLPNAFEAVKEAIVAWEGLMASIGEEKWVGSGNGTAGTRLKQKQCPYSLNRMNASQIIDHGHGGYKYKLKLPCGLVQGSSISIIGIPGGILGNFKIDLTEASLSDASIILHYNVRLHGDKVTDDPVIVQNTWTLSDDWGGEERCPSPTPGNNGKVDNLELCNQMVGKKVLHQLMSRKYSNGSRLSPLAQQGAKSRQYFPFKQGLYFVATLRVGTEGIHMTVDGKHITSFAYREGLEPWLVNEVRISGDLKLVSVLANGLPTSEDIEHVTDIESLKSPPLSHHHKLDLFVGVFSSSSNFKQRMSVRKTWMQYSSVKSRSIAVRFFVGLHKNQIVNEELWNEARIYGDIQFMPFVDYYSLITWKTIAICIYGTETVSAKYIMKTDDDAFVRLDEILASLTKANIHHGLLYGLINFDSQPHRNLDSKWYISPEEWSNDYYPPWAHGPGYVVSSDIARTVYKQYKKGVLKIFRLEDVAMGIWISEMKNTGLDVKYIKEGRIYNEGCEEGYVIAHYQNPVSMLCLWNKIQKGLAGKCCN